MSNDEQKPPEPPEQAAAQPKDFSSDYFPTSAKPVFLSMGFLILAITALCFVVWATSEHSEEPTTKVRGKQLILDEDD